MQQHIKTDEIVIYGHVFMRTKTVRSVDIEYSISSTIQAVVALPVTLMAMAIRIWRLLAIRNMVITTRTLSCFGAGRMDCRTRGRRFYLQQDRMA